MYLEGQFVQVPKGEAFKLRQRFAIIAADPRHRDVQVRYSASPSERLFPDDWIALSLHAQIDPQVLSALGCETGRGMPHACPRVPWRVTETDATHRAA